MSVLPRFDFVYLGDNARAPYGNKSFDLIHEYTLEGIEFLFNQGCELVILACNTASARALKNIQVLHLPKNRPDRRVLGVIRPSVEALAGLPCGALPGVTKPTLATGTVAVVGTESTIASDSYGLELRKLAPNLNLIQQACPLWASLVEAGELQGAGTEYFLRKSLEPIFAREEKIQKLLLGCTHYPLLLPTLRKLVPAGVEIIDQSEIVAERFAGWLKRHSDFESALGRNALREFATTDDAEWFSKRGQKLLGMPFEAVKARLGAAKMGISSLSCV